jgi:hypothetical protein
MYKKNKLKIILLVLMVFMLSGCFSLNSKVPDSVKSLFTFIDENNNDKTRLDYKINIDIDILLKDEDLGFDERATYKDNTVASYKNKKGKEEKNISYKSRLMQNTINNTKLYDAKNLYEYTKNKGTNKYTKIQNYYVSNPVETFKTLKTTDLLKQLKFKEYDGKDKKAEKGYLMYGNVSSSDVEKLWSKISLDGMNYWSTFFGTYENTEIPLKIYVNEDGHITKITMNLKNVLEKFAENNYTGYKLEIKKNKFEINFDNSKNNNDLNIKFPKL